MLNHLNSGSRNSSHVRGETVPLTVTISLAYALYNMLPLNPPGPSPLISSGADHLLPLSPRTEIRPSSEPEGLEMTPILARSETEVGDRNDNPQSPRVVLASC